jgi:hypothetical protein
MRINFTFALIFKDPTVNNILPFALNKNVAKTIAKAVAGIWRKENKI